MHGFGFPLFMGGPVVWIVLFAAAYLLIRRVGIPRRGSAPTGGWYPSKGSSQKTTETEIYRMAARYGGKITVSDVVTKLGLEPEQAEQLLDSMADGLRVRMEVSEEGMVSYVFPELKRENSE